MTAQFIDPRSLYETEVPLRQVHTALWSGVLAFPAVEALLDYYRSTAYFKLAFDAPADRARLAGRVAEILTSQFGSGPAPLTVGGAIFSCTEPIRGDASGVRPAGRLPATSTPP